MFGIGRRREQKIRELAYTLWQQAGSPPNRDLEFWTRAVELEQARRQRFRKWLAAQKDASSTVQSMATVIALIAGAIWAWLWLDPVAQGEPGLYVSQTATASKLKDGLTYLHLTLSLQNSGKVTAYIPCGDIFISQVIPVRPDTMTQLTKHNGVDDAYDPEWPTLKYKRLDNMGRNGFFVEAGNKAELAEDFVISLPSTPDGGQSELKTVEIFSYFQRAVTRADRQHCRFKEDGATIAGPGWRTTTLYDLPQVSGQTTTVVSGVSK